MGGWPRFCASSHYARIAPLKPAAAAAAADTTRDAHRPLQWRQGSAARFPSRPFPKPGDQGAAHEHVAAAEPDGTSDEEGLLARVHLEPDSLLGRHSNAHPCLDRCMRVAPLG